MNIIPIFGNKEGSTLYFFFFKLAKDLSGHLAGTVCAWPAGHLRQSPPSGCQALGHTCLERPGLTEKQLHGVVGGAGTRASSVGAAGPEPLTERLAPPGRGQPTERDSL